MNKSNYFISLSALAFSLILLINACKRDTSSPDVPQPQLTVSAINPGSAPVSSTIAIEGTNFSTTPASNTVLIGGVVATVVTATSTRLVVVVPDGATTGVVQVSADGQTAQSQTTFTVSPKPARPVVEVQGEIRRNVIWSSDTVYLLRGVVYITTDHTLTIQPGTIIKGAAADQDPTNRGFAGTLVIELQAKIDARGTATRPIVFTSAKPSGQRSTGDWGGIVLIGKSPKNRPSATPYTGGIRGTAEAYTEPFDNSGVMQYVRIEYAGTPRPAVPTDKLNGLTLYGVGSGTVLDHIQVSYSSADAFAWFGGTANMSYLVAYRTTDDDWSSDWGYAGNVQFGLSLRDPEVADMSGSNSIESQNFDPGENPTGVLTRLQGLPQTAPVFANISSFAFASTPSTAVTPRGTGAYQSGLFLRRNTALSIYNSLLVGYPEGLRLDGTATGTLANTTSNALDVKGVILANTLSPVVGGGAITNEQASAFYTAGGRSNQILSSADLASLLLNVNSFNTTSPSFLPQAGSPLLTGAVTGGKLANAFFTSVPYRGAFGTVNWTADWTNFNPQTTDYDR